MWNLLQQALRLLGDTVNPNNAARVLAVEKVSGRGNALHTKYAYVWGVSSDATKRQPAEERAFGS